MYKHLLKRNEIDLQAIRLDSGVVKLDVWFWTTKVGFEGREGGQEVDKVISLFLFSWISTLFHVTKNLVFP